MSALPYIPSVFESQWDLVQDEIHKTAKSKGWWEEERNEGEILCLIHSEVSEALEALREGNPPDDKCPGFSGVEVELADVVIRIMDYAKHKEFDVVGAIITKMEFNKGRKYKHSGKKF